ncbi:MAG: response regulator [Flavobacteriales bacterium]|nr:response regulator [Flavobacteriales bacterium]MCB9200167.1 response regulator [Flavobacteriales bacterium]
MSINSRPIRVLYVDDEQANLKAFRATYRRDFDVLTAASGQEALDLLDRETAHVVISDQRMPGMTGAELLARISERHPACMRMLLTGYADIEAVIDAVNRGRIYAYATKPWDAQDLKLRIEQAYEVYALRHEREDLLIRYRQVFDVSADPIVIVDQRGAVLDANPATERLLRTSKAELLRSGFLGHLDDPSALVATLRTKRSGKDFLNVDLTLKNGDGHSIDCLLTASYLGSREDGTAMYQAMIKDISDRLQQEKDLKRLNRDLDRRVNVRTKQLLDALEDLGSFSYTVAHDLRSPLKNILALSEHLTEELNGRESSGEHELSQRIHRGAGRMIELVDDLLRFAQTNNRAVQRENVPVLALFQEVCADNIGPEREVQVATVADGDAWVQGDRAMLKVLLNNLISNALKFTRDKDRPMIEIGHRREGDQDHVWVMDNGVGFDASRSEQAFGAFKRLHRNDQFEGSGVGLAIVDRIVSKHGGKVWAESAPGKGACIHILIPAVDKGEQSDLLQHVA